MNDLSAEIWEIVRRLFPAEQQQDVANLLLNECGNNLPFCQHADKDGLERIRFAVLKLSDGDFSEMCRWIEQAKIDWRDVLMAAGFGHSLTAHKEWLQR